MTYSNKEEFKSEILREIKIDKNNNNNSVQILKNKYGYSLSECLEILNIIYEEGINDLRDEEDKIIKNELLIFLEENKDHLELNQPFENWKKNKLLFSTNNSIKGKIEFEMNMVKFKLKHRFFPYTQDGSRSYTSPHWLNSPLEKIKTGEFSFPVDSNGELIYNKIPNLCKKLIPTFDEFKIQKEKIKNQKEKLDDDISILLRQERLEKERKLEMERLSNLNSLQNTIYTDLDKDGDGEVDLVDGESFNKLLTKHQKTISDIDKSYIQKFVKISIYLKTKRKNTQRMFESIHKTRNSEELDELVHLLKNQIHTYELLVFHSISMITSLVESDLITFYEIYESFDQLGVFNSNWENEVSNKLNDIGDGIKDLMYSIDRMEYNIVNSLDTLTYVTQDSFSELNHSITSQLGSINSSINFNNLLTGIQTYQLYKINQNLKRIN